MNKLIIITLCVIRSVFSMEEKDDSAQSRRLHGYQLYDLHNRAQYNFESSKHVHVRKFLENLDKQLNGNWYNPDFLETDKGFIWQVNRTNTVMLKDFSYKTFKLIGKDPLYHEYTGSNIYPRNFTDLLVSVMRQKYIADDWKKY